MTKRIKHGTTNAGSVTVVTLTEWHGLVEVFARGADDFWVSTDQTNDPTIAGDDFEIVTANSANTIPNMAQPPDQGVGQAAKTEVRILCATAINYSVAGR